MNTINFLNLEHLFLLVYQLFTRQYESGLPEKLVAWAHTVQILSTVFSLLLMLGIAYAAIRTHQIWREYEEEKHREERAFDAKAAGNPRWEKIMEHAASGNPNDWRQAILGADVMLNDLLDSLGYVGEGIGEKLKTVERGDFPTLDLAWEAHKVRNQIAHEGSDFLLTQREAKRTVDLYRRVFESFRFI